MVNARESTTHELVGDCTSLLMDIHHALETQNKLLDDQNDLLRKIARNQ